MIAGWCPACAVAVSAGAVPTAVRSAAQDALAAAAFRPDEEVGPQFALETTSVEVPALAAWLREGPFATWGVVGAHLRWKRLQAGRGHAFPWHRDHRRGGHLGLVVNLSPGLVSGGAFEQRRRGEGQIRVRVCSQAGDLLTFPVADPRWEHRVSPVLGPGARVVLAGWVQLRSGPVMEDGEGRCLCCRPS